MSLNLHYSRLHLASRSPRRRELLTQMGVQFDTIVLRDMPREKDVDEDSRDGEEPTAYVQRIACTKAEHGWRLVNWRRLVLQPVLAADTTLEFDGRIIGKPKDADDAERILRLLSGNAHRVLTAVAVSFNGRMESALSISEVRFRALEPREIRRYVATGEPMDKAGAYGIQGRAGLFIEHLSGSYSGVMGLPLFETGQLLKRFDFPL